MSDTTTQDNSTTGPAHDLLSKCGLNQTEQSILLFLLSHSRSSAGLISKRTGIKRPTVYSSLLNLEGYGLVIRQKSRGTVYFSSIDPSSIPILLKNRAREKFEAVNSAAMLLHQTLEDFTEKNSHNLAGYEIKVLESYSSVYAIIENSLTSGNYLSIFNPQTAFAGPGAELTKRFLKKAEASKPLIKEIAVAGPQCDWYLSEIRNPHHSVRQVDENQSIPIDLIILDDQALITNYIGDNKAMAILIKHKALCDFLKLVFNMLWMALDEERTQVAA